MPAPTDFSYRITKDNRILISWCGQQVVIVTGARAAKLMAQLTNSNPEEQQMLLARITGNFKRGNERPA